MTTPRKESLAEAVARLEAGFGQKPIRDREAVAKAWKREARPINEYRPHAAEARELENYYGNSRFTGD